MKATVIQFAKYGIVGTIGGVYNLTAIYLLTERAGLWYMGSAAFAVATTWIINFSLNKAWTFKEST